MIVVVALMGIICVTPSVVGASLVQNGGFETADLTGWTWSGDGSWTSITTTSHSGTFAVYMGPVTDGFLSQVLETTPREWYTVSFWLKNDFTAYPWHPAKIYSGHPSEFHLSWDDGEIFSLVNAPEFGYTQYSFGGQATTSSTTLSMRFQNPTALFYLDDISVTPTTAPVPLPGTLILLGSGLVGLVGIGRKRFKK